jgi:AsmA protein
MKLAVKILGAFIGLLIVVVLAFVFLVDANKFKPRIEAIARDQGIALQINGDLGWNLWPSLGVAVNEVRVAALEAPDQPIAEIKQASLLLALMPLFSGEFKVDHIAVDGATASLKVDAAGKGNWEALIKSNNPAPAPQPAPATDANLKLDIHHVSLSNSRLDYSEAQSGQAIALRDLNVSMSDVNLRAAPFPMEMSFVAELTPTGSDKLELQAKLSNNISVDSAFSNIKLDDGKLQLDVKAKESASLELRYSLALSDLKNDLTYDGQLTLAETNARKLLAALGIKLDTADKDALSKLTFSSNINGTAKKIKLDNLHLIMDSTTFKGSVAVTDFTTSALKLVLDGDKINVDHYLPPSAQEKLAPAVADAPASPPVQSQTEDTQLPIDMLRELNVNAKVALQAMTISNIDLENVAFKVLAKNGMVEPELSAKAYSGTITTKGQLDARGSQAQLQFDAGVVGLELEPLLKDQEMDSKFGLQGAVQVRALGTAQGNSVNQLFKSLRSNANFSGAQVRVSPINLEQQFCKLVNLVNKTDDQNQTWAAYTEMTELSGSVKIRDQIVTIDTFKAGVEKLQLGSTGKINLATDEYDIYLPLKLLKSKSDTVTAEQVAVTTSAGGCSIGSQYWLERGLELLRCRGSLDEINPLSDCRPDSALLTELTKDYAVYKLKEKHGAKYEEKKEELKEKQEELKEKVEKEKTRLFDKLQQRLLKGASSSAPAAEAEPGTGAAE